MPTTVGRSRGRQGVHSGAQGAAGDHTRKIVATLVAATVVIVFVLVATKAGHDIDAATQRFMLYYAGVFALVGLTGSVIVGLVATDRIVMTPGHRVMAQAVHRAVSFGALAFLVIHIVTEILAQRAHVIDAVIPFLSPFRTFYIGLGTIASDLIVLIVVTSILRKRFTAHARAWRWRAIHYSSYAAFVFGVLHGLLGGRTAEPYVDWSYGFAIAVTALGLAVRFLAISLRPKESLGSAPSMDRARPSGSSPLHAAAMSMAQVQLGGTVQVLPAGLGGSRHWAPRRTATRARARCGAAPTWPPTSRARPWPGPPVPRGSRATSRDTTGRPGSWARRGDTVTCPRTSCPPTRTDHRIIGRRRCRRTSMSTATTADPARRPGYGPDGRSPPAPGRRYPRRPARPTAARARCLASIAARCPGQGLARCPGPTPAPCRVLTAARFRALTPVRSPAWALGLRRAMAPARCLVPTPAPCRGPTRAPCHGSVLARCRAPTPARCRAMAPAPCRGWALGLRRAMAPARCPVRLPARCRGPTRAPCHPRLGSGPMPRPDVGPMPRPDSGPMPRPDTGAMPRLDPGSAGAGTTGRGRRAGTGPMPRLGTGPMPPVEAGPPSRPGTGPMPRPGQPMPPADTETGPRTGPLPGATDRPSRRAKSNDPRYRDIPGPIGGAEW